MMFSRHLKQASVAALMLGALAFPLAAQADTPDPHTINVTGQGQVTTAPDSMQLDVSVTTQGKTVEAARSGNARKMSSVNAALKSLNVPHLVLKTTNFNLNPIYERDVNPKSTKGDRVVGYSATNSLNLKAEELPADTLAIDASRLYDTALKAGADTSNGPSFYLSKNNVAHQQAIRLAVKQARQTADTLAEAAGIRITGVHGIETYSAPTPMRARGMMYAKAADAEAAPTPIEVGDTDVNASVTIRYDFQ